jgi:hypothetical protein
MTRRTAAEVAAVRHLRRVLAELPSDPSTARYAAGVRGSRASALDPTSDRPVDNRPAVFRARLLATLAKLGLVVVCFGGVLVALSSRHAFNAGAAIAVGVLGVTLGAVVALKCRWDVAHLAPPTAPPRPPREGALHDARSRWLSFLKKGELTDVPLVDRTHRSVATPDDEWWTRRSR